MANLNFDATHVAPDAGFDVIPAGWYKVMIDESELKPTKDGNGAYLSLRFNVTEGPYKGRKVFARLNIKNNNEQAQKIAHGQLSAIAHAVRVLQVADSTQLHNIPLQIKVKVRPADPPYDEANDITSYKHINEPVGSQAAAAAPAAPAPGPAPQPWQQGYQQPAGAAPPPPPAAPPPPPPPPAVPAVPVVQRPTDPSHIHAAGTPGEKWWINGAWQDPPQPAAPAAPPPPPAPGPWTPPAGGQPWQHQPPAAPAAAAASAAPAAPSQPPHPAQTATPPWATRNQ